MINGVKIKKLIPISDERGRVMEVLRRDDKVFRKFGQVYITTAYPGVVKAWHYHKKQTDSFTVLHGMVKMVLYDARPKSPSRGELNEFFIGVHNPILLQIPPDVYHGFKCVSEHEAIMMNCPSEPYNRAKPDEYRIPAHSDEIPYDWARKDG
jgi:dTDP-4-dehydrorhamnose 3,5-epimerase